MLPFHIVSSTSSPCDHYPELPSLTFPSHPHPHPLASCTHLKVVKASSEWEHLTPSLVDLAAELIDRTKGESRG